MTTDSWPGDDEAMNENMYKWWHTGSVTRRPKMNPSNNIIHIPNHIFEYKIVSFAGGEWWHIHKDAVEELLATMLVGGVVLREPPIYVSHTFAKTIHAPIDSSVQGALGILYKSNDMEIQLETYGEFMNCRFEVRR